MSNELALLDEDLIVARGGTDFDPDAKFGIKRQDLGEADVSTNISNTFEDRKTRKKLNRIVIKRVKTDSTNTITVTCYQERKPVLMMKNLAPAEAIHQDAAVGLALPDDVAGITEVAYGQLVNVGKVGIFGVALKAGTAAGATVLQEEVDYHVINTSGDIEFLKAQKFGVGGLQGTFSCIEDDGDEYALNTYDEVTGYLTVHTVAEDDARSSYKRWYVGIAPNGDITEVTGDDGEIGWAFEARVLADPKSSKFVSGRMRNLPTMAAIQEAIDAANGDDGDDGTP